MAVSALAGCGALPQAGAPTVTVTVSDDPDGQGAAGTDEEPTPAESPAPSATPWPTDAAREREAFEEGFSQVQTRLSGPASVALMPVGGGRSLQAGEKTNGYAWSIIKVPIALVALRERDTASVREDVVLALRDSDNDAAARLWDVAGESSGSGKAVQSLLREAGDDTTDALRGSRDGFGHIRWSVGDSAQFTAMLPCLEGAEPVLEEMANVGTNQHWGFANVPGARVKGGWGPVHERYLVRQIAVLPAAEGTAVASVIVDSPTFEQGQQDLDILADWAAGFAEGMGGSCREER